MTKYGFVIDQRKCIGCHACTIACKSENQVPVGSFRTWVKYIEKGVFPNTRRYFTVERCQHCEDAPCVAICPTRALFKRRDGIVDFDSDRCIGCKSCMQACPYDALYIDPNTHTAAKCNYCAHRTDRGLLPACVIVCPVKAIIAGDLDDASSEIAQTLAREQVQVRRPDQGTRPQVFYVGADETAITPGLATQPRAYMWSELGPANVALEPKGAVEAGRGSVFGGGSVARGRRSGAWDSPSPLPTTRPARERQTDTPAPSNALDGLVAAVRAEVEASPRRDGAMRRERRSERSSSTHAVTVYDVPHPQPWGWRVSSYLWTKSIGGGALAVAGPLLALGLLGDRVSTGAGLLAVLFTVLTAILLVWDLKRPDRFWRVVLTPNLRSWLPWGAYILTVYGALAAAWFVASAAGADSVPEALAWPVMIGGAAACAYSAFLFGQAEGRDFWQSPLLLWQLLGAAALAGGAVLVLIAIAADRSNHAQLTRLSSILLGGVLATLAVVMAEVATPHSNKDVATAAATLKRGSLARRFWFGYALVGAVLPSGLLVAALAGAPLESLSAAAAVLALAGLWFYEDAWIRAGQSVAMS